MPVLLRQSRDLPEAGDYTSWLSILAAPSGLDPERKRAGLAAELERQFDTVRDRWWEMGRALAQTRGGDLAHTPTCSTFISDFGEMLAWGNIVERSAKGSETVLVVCDDPWIFRHLSLIDGVSAGRPPVLFPQRFGRALRGWLARTNLMLRLLMTKFQLRHHRNQPLPAGAPVILVYGHPTSTADGFDAYFGNLMESLPGLIRVLHTDCRTELAGKLSADGRTVSLHAWGSALFALMLPFARWRPAAAARQFPERWLIRRAAVLENGGAALAMTRWQSNCQNRWLDQTRPISVAWSWENHPWERLMVREARRRGVRTLGSQDTDVGRHQWNMAAFSNPDGAASLPDILMSNGPAYGGELKEWGIPEDRIVCSGSFRVKRQGGSHYDPDGPIFVALSSIPAISKELMRAVDLSRDGKRRFMIKEHPMYPFAVAETEDVFRIGTTIPGTKDISAVVYGTGLSGLEGMMFGVPTIRILPADRIGIDTLPHSVRPISVTAEELDAVIGSAPTPPEVNWDELFVEADREVWRSQMLAEA
jgi:hypothetical protein